MQLRGRHLVIAWIAVFLVVAGTIGLRQRRGFEASRRVRALRTALEAVTARHTALSSDLAEAVGAPLRVRAESLGLRSPSDSELVNLAVPPR